MNQFFIKKLQLFTFCLHLLTIHRMISIHQMTSTHHYCLNVRVMNKTYCFPNWMARNMTCCFLIWMERYNYSWYFLTWMALNNSSPTLKVVNNFLYSSVKVENNYLRTNVMADYYFYWCYTVQAYYNLTAV